LLAPFGLDIDFSNLTEALKKVTDVFKIPLQFIANIGDFLEDLFGDLFGLVAGLHARISAIEVSLAPGDEVGGYDNCSKSTKFTVVAGGSLVATNGAIRGPAFAAGIYQDSPSSDRHGAGVKLTNKQPGLTRLVICSDATMTNYVALQFEPTFNDVDMVSVVTGTSPTTVVTQTTNQMEIPNNSFWEIRYEPFDELSETSNTFHVYANGEEIIPLRWTDGGNLVVHGAEHCSTGIQINGLSKIGFNRGFSITDFTWYDWVAAAPA
jgi:hypothetical protein